MKSIIEEASSVIKAIEKGWTQAGKPQEFSVKIFQEAEKNFLGMTTKSAKIAILFESAQKINEPWPEKKAFKQLQQAEPRQKYSGTDRKQKSPDRPVMVPKERVDIVSERPFQLDVAEVSPSETQLPGRSELFWSEAMLAEITQWLQGVLGFLALSDVEFTFEQKRYYLKINFRKPLFQDVEKEKTTFRSFAYLLMQVLRNKFKRNFRGFKLILTSDV